MRVLVTGTGGFSGGHMATALESAGHEVWRHFHQAGAASPRTVLGDLADGITLPDGLQAVVHCAARSGQGGVSDRKLDRDNRLATEKLVAAGLEAGVDKFIYFSSLSIYGEIQDKEVTEETVIRHPNCYGRTKFAGEEALAAVADRLPSVSFRLPGILGQGARRHWLAGLAEKMLAGREVTVFNPDSPFNNAVHIRDLCWLVADLLDRPLQGADRLVLGASEPLPIRDVAERLRQGLNSASEIRVGDKPGAVSFTLSSDRAVTYHGYRPAPMADLLARYAEDCLLEQASTIR